MQKYNLIQMVLISDWATEVDKYVESRDVLTYTGNAKDRVLVVLLSDRREMLPEYAIWPDIDTGPDIILGPQKLGP